VLTREADAETRPDELEGHLHAYLEELQLHRYSETSQGHARRALALFFDYLRENEIEDLRKVSEADILGFARLLQTVKTPRGETLSLRTQATYRSSLRRFFAFLDKRSIILHNPARILPVPRVKPLPRAVMSEAQVSRLLEAPSPTSSLGLRDRAILEILYGTAIRLRECVRLDLGDVDLQQRSLWVRTGKGKKDRLLPIPRQAAEALDSYLREARSELLHDLREQALFLSSAGKRLGPAQIEALVRNYAQAAGTPFRVTPHALRHSCATHLLQRGVDLRHIQQLLGHHLIQTTAIYTRVAVKDLREILSRAHPRERRWRRRTRPKRR
jgi:integrase/recombinase XerD